MPTWKHAEIDNIFSLTPKVFPNGSLVRPLTHPSLIGATMVSVDTASTSVISVIYGKNKANAKSLLSAPSVSVKIFYMVLNDPFEKIYTSFTNNKVVSSVAATLIL